MRGIVLVAWLMVVGGSVLAAEPLLSGGPYVPTPQRIVDEMLGLARVTRNDVVMDLGSGDGRIVLTAARQFGARGKGYDIDAELVARSNAAARQSGVERLAQFELRDVMEADIREATVVTLYLLPEMMRMLRARLLTELRPGTRIVSHDFDFGDWKPLRSMTLELDEKYDVTGSATSTIHLWIVPQRTTR